MNDSTWTWWVSGVALLAGATALWFALPWDVAWWRVLVGSLGFVLLLAAGWGWVQYSAEYLSAELGRYFRLLTDHTSPSGNDEGSR